MSKDNEFLYGINNYCLNYHTMNDTKFIFNVYKYEAVKKSLLNENFYLINNNFFVYDKLLTRE